MMTKFYISSETNLIKWTFLYFNRFCPNYFFTKSQPPPLQSAPQNLYMQLFDLRKQIKFEIY